METKMENDMETGGIQDSNNIVRTSCILHGDFLTFTRLRRPRSGDPIIARVPKFISLFREQMNSH